LIEQDNTLLQVESLVTGYGNKRVISDVTLSVGRGRIVAIIGHNGAGKTTLLRAIFGLLPAWHGRVILDGQAVPSPFPRRLLNRGVIYVPQADNVFNDLTVQENLEMGDVMLADRRILRERIEYSLDLFPSLRNRMSQRAGTLSGGERQMLAVARAMIPSPRLLLLDEPSLGLAPQLVSDLLGRLQDISQNFGTAVLIVEQKVRQTLKVAQRVYVLRNGAVSFSGESSLLDDEDMLCQVYL